MAGNVMDSNLGLVVLKESSITSFYLVLSCLLQLLLATKAHCYDTL